MVENVGLVEPGRHVTFLTHSPAEYACWMGVLMTGLASRDFNGAKLAFSYMTAAAGLILVESGQRKLSLTIVIEFEVSIQLGPALGVMTVLALVEVRLSSLTMITAMTGLTCIRGV